MKNGNQRRRYIIFILLIITAFLITLIVSLVFYKFENILASQYILYGIIIIDLATMIFSLVTIIDNMKLFKTPTSLTLSLLGLPSSGKTVYLTVLFRELLIREELPGFSIYGEETVERVQEDYKTLQYSNWLPPTDTIGSNVFYYRATVNSAGIIQKPKYKLEIADYAGEFLQEDLIANESYFHRTKYFKYVLSSDVIFPIIDLSRYCKEGRNYIVEIEGTLIAALDIFRQNKTTVGKCKTPICILFLKSDFLSAVEGGEEKILGDFKNLFTYIATHYMFYNKFFVSAISPTPLQKEWGDYLSPENVVSPLEWALRVVRR